MTLSLTVGSASELFAGAFRAVLAAGQPAEPRGLPTIEVLGATLTLTDPRRAARGHPAGPGDQPGVRRRRGNLDPVRLRRALDLRLQRPARRLRRRRPPHGSLRPAAAPLARHHRPPRQCPACAHQRPRDQARGHPALRPRNRHARHKDVPCTLGYRFFLRDGRLHMHTTMRSQDLWLGFSYDIFTATILQELLAGWLGAKTGSYLLSVDTLHL